MELFVLVCSVVVHVQHHGLKLQWLDSFQPPRRENGFIDERVIGIVLEDDLEVSCLICLFVMMPMT